jgi:Flp pilus assembly pilin Flp
MIRKALARIHRDEQGIEALQAVMVMAVAAVVLALVKTQWPSVKTYFTTKVNNITTFND